MKSKKQMSLCLEQTKAGEKFGWGPLAESIDAALTTLWGKDKIGGALSLDQERRNMAERAIRAVCEMIVREGHMICPLEVQQTHLAARAPRGKRTVLSVITNGKKASAIELTANQTFRLSVYAKDRGETFAETVGKFIDFATMADEHLDKPRELVEIDDAMNALKMGGAPN